MSHFCPLFAFDQAKLFGMYLDSRSATGVVMLFKSGERFALGNRHVPKRVCY